MKDKAVLQHTMIEEEPTGEEATPGAEGEVAAPAAPEEAGEEAA